MEIDEVNDSELSIRDYYEEFVDEVLDADLTWGLQNEAGWASCESNDFEERQVILFFSSEE